jgi:Tfp pilus assembly PilM family ATPase
MNVEFLRSKMVSFRLSPEEYQRFRNLCAAHGARSISELARTALNRLNAGTHQADPLSYEIGDLRRRVQSISEEVDRLSGVLGARKTGEG